VEKIKTLLSITPVTGIIFFSKVSCAVIGNASGEGVFLGREE